MDIDTEKILRELLRKPVDEAFFQYVVENAHVILFWPMERFCSRSGATEEQVYDLLDAFGVDSLNDFKNILRNALYQERREQGVAKRQLSSIVAEMVNNEKKNLNDVVRDMDYERMDRLTQDILEASEVVLMGADAYVGHFAYMLNKLGIRARRLKSMQDILLFMGARDRKALVIVFGIARYSKEMVLRVSRLRRYGFRIVAFTDRHDSPYVDLSEYYFFLPVRCFDFVDSFTAGLTLVNTVILNIGLHDEQKMISQLSNFNSLAEDVDFFF